jgi:hypothetical protein
MKNLPRQPEPNLYSIVQLHRNIRQADVGYLRFRAGLDLGKKITCLLCVAYVCAGRPGKC